MATQSETPGTLGGTSTKDDSGTSDLEQKAGEKAEEGKARTAGALDRFSDTLDEKAGSVEQSGQAGQKAGQVAHKASDMAEEGADYLRNRDFSEMWDDLEVQVSRNPLASVGIALGAGFVLARVFK